MPEVAPRLLEPNPRAVSRELLLRDEFSPATTLNVARGAWLQFEIRDWFSHGTDPSNRSVGVPARAGRRLAGRPDG